LFNGKHLRTSDGSGSKFLTRVESSRIFVAWVGFGFGKFSPKNPKFFNFLPFGSKSTRLTAGLVSFYCGSKVCLGHLYLGPYDNEAVYYLLASGFQDKKCHCYQWKMVSLISNERSFSSLFYKLTKKDLDFEDVNLKQTF